jgi:acyl-CoA synthetase (AMP-forming)/AMP-acid ligase II
VLYNLYGSTEVAYAAVATPEDLQADPGTAGKPPHGVTLRVVDEHGQDCPPGEPGRIFVGSGLAFGGYTDGSDKDRLDGLVSTGDLGLLDDEGRLTVLGRDDDMVVIGGENVYPGRSRTSCTATRRWPTSPSSTSRTTSGGRAWWRTSCPRTARRSTPPSCRRW